MREDLIELPTSSGIYGIQHIYSQRTYLASSTNIRQAATQDYLALISGSHSCSSLQSAFALEGSKHFLFIPLTETYQLDYFMYFWSVVYSHLEIDRYI